MTDLTDADVEGTETFFCKCLSLISEASFNSGTGPFGSIAEGRVSVSPSKYGLNC